MVMGEPVPWGKYRTFTFSGSTADVELSTSDGVTVTMGTASATAPATLPDDLAERVVRFSQSLRKADLRKQPGVSEVLDWALALVAVGAGSLSAPRLRRTLGALLKNREDLERVLADLSRFR